MSIRNEFPILESKINDKPLVYLDNAATTQKPKSVISGIKNYYLEQNANTHSLHYLASQLTEKQTEVRSQVAKFVGAKEGSEIAFCYGTTDSLNTIAGGITDQLKEGDEIIISIAEHHANWLCWDRICKVTGAKLIICSIQQSGEVDYTDFKNKLSERTKIVALNHVSNVTGKENSLAKIGQILQNHPTNLVIDGAQAIAHKKLDLKNTRVDYYAFSTHKMYGPTGLGILYGRADKLSKLKPFRLGGDMVNYVSKEKIVYRESPYHLEAGTQNFAAIIGLQASLEFMNKYSQRIYNQDSLIDYFSKELTKIKKVSFLGKPNGKSLLTSFYIEGFSALDLAEYLNTQGIAVRVGYHCAQPLHEYYKAQSSLRVSLAVYNTKDEIDYTLSKIQKGLQLLSS